MLDPPSPATRITPRPNIPSHHLPDHTSSQTEGSVGCLNFNVPVNFEVISEMALGTIESMLPHCDVRSACIHHTQSYYPDTGPTRLNTKSIMPDTRRISC
ncbi:hypothetical protein ElyMa_005975900 [Elysia marginata]|uniref:Uncharacterized protein n=1 Tax=Elysia marginata TaxID=1093978 RepID=A0AAV4GDX1_9GAST|nr:hypothetical protein ElyMa_005975900 [Elysia marginata]